MRKLRQQLLAIADEVFDLHERGASLNQQVWKLDREIRKIILSRFCFMSWNCRRGLQTAEIAPARFELAGGKVGCERSTLDRSTVAISARYVRGRRDDENQWSDRSGQICSRRHTHRLRLRFQRALHRIRRGRCNSDLSRSSGTDLLPRMRSPAVAYTLRGGSDDATPASIARSSIQSIWG